MRITRAAKVAAFPLTALILVALVACQGPAGPAGAAGGKGDPGSMGTPGTSGTSGTPGTPAFQVKTDVTPELLNDSDLVDKNGRKLDNEDSTTNLAETATLTIDLDGYFVGGSGDREYKIIGSWGANSETPATNTAAAAAIKAEVKGSTLEYTLTRPDGGWDADAFENTVGDVMVDRLYSDGFTAMVRGTDDGIAADATVAIMLNRKPDITGEDTNPADDVLDESVVTGTGNAVLVLGIQDLKRRDTGNMADVPLPFVAEFHKACAKIQECVMDVFTDQGDIMVTVVSMTRNDLMDSSKVGWSADGDAVTLIGMASTWDKDRKNTDGAADAGHAPVTVKLKATDTGEQSAEISVLVAVNEPPTLSKGASNIVRSGKTKVGASASLTADAAGLFFDLEGDMFDVRLPTSSNKRVATAEIGTVAGADGNEGHLVVNGIAAGSATITLTATSNADGMFQTASMEFTVTVE